MAGLIIAGAVLIATGGAARNSVWADVSVIWLLIPALIIALTIMTLVVTTIYGMAKLLQILPHYTGKAQGIFSQVSSGTRKLGDGAARPFVWFHQAGAVIKYIFRL
jgi:hypothetical protein